MGVTRIVLAQWLLHTGEFEAVGCDGDLQFTGEQFLPIIDQIRR